MHPAANSIIAEDIARIVAAGGPWDALSGASVLITGAAGFLPAYMVETLLRLNETELTQPAHVVALVRNEERARIRFAAYAGRRDFEILAQDVCAPGPPGRRFDYIVHAASQASPRYYRVDPVGTLLPNVLGTYQLLEMSRATRVKSFLYFSSGDVYGEVPGGSGRTGELDFGYVDPTHFRSCYGESKRMGETMCVAWAHQYGVPARMVRPFHTYGPGMRLDDGRVFADFVRDILNGGPIVLRSDGTARRCFCYLADATEAFFRVLLQGETGQAYNVANSDAECSIGELADRLAKEFAGDGIRVAREPRGEGEYVPSPIALSQPDIGKVRKLGWEPSTGIDAGFRRTVESFQGKAAKGFGSAESEERGNGWQ